MALWDKIGSSGNVEDRRGQRTTIATGGGLVSMLLVAAFVLLSGGSTNDALTSAFEQLSESQTSQTSQRFEDPTNYADFAGKVLGSNNEVWRVLFEQQGASYIPPKLVLFRDVASTGCGVASSAVGPFYCPSDQTIYLDETFFDAIKTQLGADAGGEDVAQAYVISHETGHHVQNLLGAMTDVASDPDTSTHLELQADCYAGIWANSVKHLGIFENDNEINEAIRLASAIGDDKIQEKTTGQINPETWTHGSGEQRVNAFKSGYMSGDLDSCR